MERPTAQITAETPIEALREYVLELEKYNNFIETTITSTTETNNKLKQEIEEVQKVNVSLFNKIPRSFIDDKPANKEELSKSLEELIMEGKI